MTNFRADLFTSVGRISTRLPRFRGRNRALLALFRVLGLETQHVFVNCELKFPVPFHVRLDLHSWLQRIAFLSEEYESDTVTFLLKLHESVTQGGYVLDIGANVGLISIPTALSLENRQIDDSAGFPRVISLEAVEDNANALRHNIALNSADQLITVINTALGDKVGSVEIQVEGDLRPGEGTGTANILPEGTTLDPNGTYNCVRIPLEISTLDVLFASGDLTSSCSVIKIDTDGYDLKVLQGGKQFLQASCPIIFGEFSAHCLQWHGQSIDDVAKFAFDAQYLVWQKVPGLSWQFTREIKSNSFVQDLLLVPTEHAGAVAWCCEPGARPADL